MILPPDDAGAFFRLLSHLDSFVSRRAKVVPGLEAADQTRGATVAQLEQIRKILWSDRSLIDAFVAENPDRLDPAELDEIRAFGLAVAGRFTIERDLPDHTIFHAEDGRVYGVVGLSEPVVDIVGRSGIALPVLVTTALLPFRGRIVWDGLPAVSLVLLGPNQRRSLAVAYTHARKRGAILASLEPEAPTPASSTATTASWSRACPRNAGTNRSITSEATRSGSSSHHRLRGTRTRSVRAAPGTLARKPRASSVLIIEFTVAESRRRSSGSRRLMAGHRGRSCTGG